VGAIGEKTSRSQYVQNLNHRCSESYSSISIATNFCRFKFSGGHGLHLLRDEERAILWQTWLSVSRYREKTKTSPGTRIHDYDGQFEVVETIELRILYDSKMK
jgi:hypothetical protein